MSPGPVAILVDDVSDLLVRDSLLPNALSYDNCSTLRFSVTFLLVVDHES